MTFREFQESEAHIDRPQANSYAQRRYFEVGIIFGLHLGGLLVVKVSRDLYIQLYEGCRAGSLCHSSDLLPAAATPD